MILSKQLLLAACLTLAISVSHTGGLEMQSNSQAATLLGISKDGRQFTVNDQPTFLIGISYYGATSIERPEAWREELKQLRELGYNWIRIWITWAHGDEDFSAVDRDGNLTEPYWSRFKEIVAYCDRIGIVGAKVTVFRPGGLDNPEALIAFREARTAYGYVGQDTPDFTIGLGDEQTCDIRVQFLNGIQRVVRDVESGTAIIIDASKK